jgi:hypothetical protein
MCDNNAAVKISKDNSANKRTQHSKQEFFYVNKQLHQGRLEIEWVPSQQKLADIMTKALGPLPFERILASLNTAGINRSNTAVQAPVGQALSNQSTCRRVGQACPISSWDRLHRTSQDRSDKSVQPVGSCFGQTVPVRPPVKHGCLSTAQTAVFDRLMPAVQHVKSWLTKIRYGKYWGDSMH